MLVALTLGGFMRWDIRHPEKRFGDRFVLVAGHTVPVDLRDAGGATTPRCTPSTTAPGTSGTPCPQAEERQLVWRDLLGFRRNKGLAGHAEMEGKTLFLKFNTGPSGHGSPPAAGEAMALKRAGADGGQGLRGRGRGRPDAGRQPRDEELGLGPRARQSPLPDRLERLRHRRGARSARSSTATRAPGSSRTASASTAPSRAATGPSVTRALLETMQTPNPDQRPNMTWFKTIKGRGYSVTGYKSHGTPHRLNSELFWQLRKEFADKYGVQWHGFGEAAPSDPARAARPVRGEPEGDRRHDHERRRAGGLHGRPAGRARRVGAGGDPRLQAGHRRSNPWQDKRLWDFRNYPTEMYVKPGTNVANRAALAKWGAWVNSFGRQDYGRPLFLAMSADLAESTNIAGFADGFGDMQGWGRYDREHNPRWRAAVRRRSPSSPTPASAPASPASTSRRQPLEEFDGFYAAHSTYASFSYLKYGLMRLFSQIAQDSDIKVGKVLWVAGHSGPETAEDSRTHFGIYETGRDGAVPRGPRDQHHPLGVQRGAGADRRGHGHRRAHRRAAPDPAADPGAGPRRARHRLALRGGARRLPDSRLQAGPAEGWARSWSRARCRPTTRSACCRSWTSSG